MLIGLKLKEIRLNNGMTQTELAKRLGLSHTTICLYESDSRKPSIARITEIATIFNVSADYFFYGNVEDEQLSEKMTTIKASLMQLTETELEIVSSLVRYLKSMEAANNQNSERLNKE